MTKKPETPLGDERRVAILEAIGAHQKFSDLCAKTDETRLNPNFIGFTTSASHGAPELTPISHRAQEFPVNERNLNIARTLLAASTELTSPSQPHLDIILRDLEQNLAEPIDITGLSLSNLISQLPLLSRSQEGSWNHAFNQVLSSFARFCRETNAATNIPDIDSKQLWERTAAYHALLATTMTNILQKIVDAPTLLPSNIDVSNLLNDDLPDQAKINKAISGIFHLTFTESEDLFRVREAMVSISRAMLTVANAQKAA